MNVCIVASSDFFSDYGGGQVYVRNIVDELIQHKEITTNVISFNKSQEQSVREYKSILVYLVNDEASLKDALKTINPDIVHANGEKLLTSRLCKQLDIPCIVTAHHGGLVCPAGALLNTNDEICNISADYNHCLKCYLRNTPTGLFWYPLLKRYSQQHYSNIGKRLEHCPFIPYLTPIGRTGQIVTQKLEDRKELIETATHFIAPSNAIAEVLERNGCPKEKISVIPHGIPNSEFQISSFESINSQFSIFNSQIIRFYYAGRINYIKGIHILLKAFSSIDNPNIELHLIGGASNKAEQRYHNRLKRKFRKDTRIIWHGKMPYEQMSVSIKDYHCLIHPTICLEVFGLDISEALQLNQYVIATRCGGAEMQILNEDQGIIVEPNDAISLQFAIEQYAKQPRQSIAKVNRIDEHINSLVKTYSAYWKYYNH